MVRAQEEARNLGHNYIGTEHVLLGLVREEQGVAAQVLGRLGVELETIRTRVIELLGDQARVDPPPPESPETSPPVDPVEQGRRELAAGLAHALLDLATGRRWHMEVLMRLERIERLLTAISKGQAS